MARALVVALVVALVAAIAGCLAACHAPASPSGARPAGPGLSIAIYASADGGYAVIDDRRYLEIRGRSIRLPNIDPGAELASLVLEPADPALHVGPCTRERMPGGAATDAAPDAAPPEDHSVPVVACTVTAPPGRYLVRILYVTATLRYRAQHDIDVHGDAGAGEGGARARVSSRYAIDTPAWQAHADAVLYDGVPGDEHVPREVARGPITLDGSVAVIVPPARNADTRLRRVYEGAVVSSDDSADPAWGRDSVQAVWVWLELADFQLAPGAVRVHLALPGEGIRDLDVAPTSRRRQVEPGAPLRVPLWIDESLRGSRQRTVEYNDGVVIIERFGFGIANTGDRAREVWIEEPMRHAARRRLARAWPATTSVADAVLRTKLEVRPGAFVRAGYTINYEL